MASNRRLAAAAAVVTALAASAPPAARADWILGGFLGHAATQTSTVTFDLPAIQTRVDAEGVTYSGRSFESPQYYGYRVTWVPERHDWIGVELEYIHAKVYAETHRIVRLRGTLQGAPVDARVPLASLAPRLVMSHGLNFVFGNLTLRRRVGPADARGRPRVVAVARAGAGPTVPHAESTIEGESRDQYEAGGSAVQVAGGLEVTVWRRMAATGEYKRTWATPVIDVAGGEATIPSRSHHVTFGVAYRF